MSAAQILNNESSTNTKQWELHKYWTMSVTQILNNESSTNTKQWVQHKY